MECKPIKVLQVIKAVFLNFVKSYFFPLLSEVGMNTYYFSFDLNLISC